MTTVDYDAELPKAGANVESRWGAIRHMARRYPLGAIGAAIMFIFVFFAIFADVITAFDPLSVNASISLARPDAHHWLGADYMGRAVYSRSGLRGRIHPRA